MSPKFVYIFYLVWTTPETILIRIFALQMVFSKFSFLAISEIVKIGKTYHYLRFAMRWNICNPLLKSGVLVGRKFWYHFWIAIQPFWIECKGLNNNSSTSKWWTGSWICKNLKILSCCERPQRSGVKNKSKNEKITFWQKNMLK